MTGAAAWKDKEEKEAWADRWIIEQLLKKPKK